MIILILIWLLNRLFIFILLVDSDMSTRVWNITQISHTHLNTRECLIDDLLATTVYSDIFKLFLFVVVHHSLLSILLQLKY